MTMLMTKQTYGSRKALNDPRMKRCLDSVVHVKLARKLPDIS